MRQAEEDRSGWILAVGSVTNAMRGREALLGAAIHGEVVPVGDKEGCGYGIRVSGSQKENARHVLALRHIAVRRVLQETHP